MKKNLLSVFVLLTTVATLTVSVAYGQVDQRRRPARKPMLKLIKRSSRLTNSQYMAQLTQSRDKSLATKSNYQANFYTKLSKISEIVQNALPNPSKYGVAYTGEDNNVRSTINDAQATLERCLTEALQKKFNTPNIEEENEVFGYLLWWFDEIIAAIERIVKSETVSDGKKAESITTIVRGCIDFSNSVSSSVTDYKNKIVESMNKSVMSAAPSKPTTLNVDSVYITVYSKSTITGLSNPGKGNYCNTGKDLENGKNKWTNPSKALALDGSPASIDLVAGETSNKLKITDCAILLPSRGTDEVYGVKVDIRKSITTSNKEVGKDKEIKLTIGNQEIGLANASTSAWTSKYVLDSFGGEKDTWGATIDPKETRNIGVVISVKNEGVAPAQAAAPTTVAAAPAPAVTAAVAPAKKNPLTVLLEELKAKGAVSPKTEGPHVKALQDVLVTLKIGKQAEDLANALKSGTGSGVAGNMTVAAYDILNQFLAYWADKNSMTKDEDFATVIKANSAKVKTFGVANAQALIKYIQQSQKKKS